MSTTVDPDDLLRKRWNDTGGMVADRTNAVVNALLEWAAKTDHDKVSNDNVADAVREMLPVDTDNTVQEYVARVLKHGPFAPADTAMTWRIEWAQATKTEAAQDEP